MRVRVFITVQQDEVGDALFDRLRGIQPIDPRLTLFDLRLPEDDPRTVNVLRELENAGLRPWLDVFRPREKRQEYSIYRYREYDDRDHSCCNALRLEPQDEVSGVLRNESGLVRLGPRGLDSRIDIARTEGSAIVVPDRVRGLLETRSLRGLRFCPTVLYDRRELERQSVRWGSKEFPEPWWELTSELTLPPMSPAVVKTTPKGDPVPRDFQGMLMLREPPFTGVEFHYLKSDLRRFGDFDLAQTFERFGTQPDDRWLVASKRFYEFCKANKIKCGWVPVRIDEG